MANARGERATSVWDDALPRVARLLPAFLPNQRWFGGKGRRIRKARTVDRVTLRGAPHALLTIVEVTYADRDIERYVLPLAIGYGDDAASGPIVLRQGAMVIFDATGDDAFCRALPRAIDRGAEVRTERGGLIRFVRGPALGKARLSLETLAPRPVGAEQSNSSIVYGDRLILKLFRRLQTGDNPEVEVLRFLARHTSFDRVPPLGGWAEYQARDGRQASLAILQGFVRSQGDGWSYVLRALERLLADAAAAQDNRGRAREDDRVAWVRQRCRECLASLAELGRVTAGLHLALGSSHAVPAFAPRRITTDDVRAWHADIAARLMAALGQLRDSLDRQPDAVRTLGQTVLAAEPRLRQTIDHLTVLGDRQVVKTRYHGDYHLGQVLKTADSFMILDFEGEPLRPLAERRSLHTPLKDVAGMLRSLNYARHAASRASGADGAPLVIWERLARAAFLRAYVQRARSGGARFLPPTDAAVERALSALELEKAAYELQYELSNRPDWVAIPLAALASRVERHQSKV